MMHSLGPNGPLRVNASLLRDQGMAVLGERRYFEDFMTNWNSFKAQGGVKGLNLVWGNGMDGIKAGWESLLKEEIGPDKGLVYKL